MAKEPPTGELPVAITHIQSLVDGDAVDQLFFQDQYGWTAFVDASLRSAPLELYQLMITKAKLDSRKRCLLAIINQRGETALRYAAANHSDPAVLELLIREHPLALSATDRSGGNNCPAQIISLLTDTTNALAVPTTTAPLPPASTATSSRSAASSHPRPPRSPRHAPPLHRARLRLRPQEQAPAQRGAGDWPQHRPERSHLEGDDVGERAHR